MISTEFVERRAGRKAKNWKGNLGEERTGRGRTKRRKQIAESFS